MLETLLAALLSIALVPIPAYAYYRLAVTSHRPSHRRWGAAAGLIPVLFLVVLASAPTAFVVLFPLALPAAFLVAACAVKPQMLERPRIRLLVSLAVGASVLVWFGLYAWSFLSFVSS